MGFDLQHYLKSKQSLVDRRLDSLITAEPNIPPSLRDAIRYSLLAPGKRLRPCLVFMASDAAGGNDDAALPAACAVEMIHAYSLVHDDLPAMDDDDLRRGLPTCHKKFGEALAILTGDALLTLAFQILAQHYPPQTSSAACLTLARASGAAGMVGGQLLDLASERREVRHDEPGASAERFELPAPLREDLEQIHTLKTGALFRACLRLGVLAAQGQRPGGPDPDLMQRLDQFGHCFGLVFQITDDLLDVESNSAATGKRTQKDSARGKLTYPGLLGIEGSRRAAQALVDQAASALEPLGSPAEGLAALLRYIVTRQS